MVNRGCTFEMLDGLLCRAPALPWPGHTAGSIVLIHRDGVVFSGDALLSDRHGQVRPPDPRLALDRAQALASAERIKTLPIKLLCTGHGAPVHM